MVSDGLIGTSGYDTDPRTDLEHFLPEEGGPAGTVKQATDGDRSSGIIDLLHRLIAQKKRPETS